MLSLYFFKLMWKIEEHEGKEKTYLMLDYYIVDKALDKTKEIIGIEKFDDTKILINTDNRLSDDITLKRGAIKDGNKFYPKLFLDNALYDE